MQRVQELSRIQFLERIVQDVAAFEFCASTEAELTDYTNLARALGRGQERLLFVITQRAAELHAEGVSGSPEDVLGAGGHVSSSSARRESRRAKTAAAIPALGAALEAGLASGEHVDIAGRVTSRLTDEQREHLDVDQLADAATKLSPDAFEKAAKGLVDAAKDDWGLGRAIEERQDSELTTRRDRSTGMGHISVTLDPERFAAFKTQLEAEVKSLAASREGEADAAGQPVKVSKDKYLAADALISLLEKGTGSLGRPTVFVHVDAETATNGAHDGSVVRSVRETDCGHTVPPETIQRFMCDSVIQPLLVDGITGEVLNVGRKYRTATERQWAAIKGMYDSCAWLDCDRPLTWCQAHHVQFWEHGGPTDIGNLVPLCSHHHHQVHDGKWGLTLGPDRVLNITTPRGDPWKDVPLGRRGT